MNVQRSLDGVGLGALAIEATAESSERLAKNMNSRLGECVMKHFRVSQVVVLTVCAILLVPSALAQAVPEPAGWYSGDMHVHRSCGGPPESVSSMFSRMTPQNLAVVSQLADSGNGEVQNPVTDLPLVNGQDDPISTDRPYPALGC